MVIKTERREKRERCRVLGEEKSESLPVITMTCTSVKDISPPPLEENEQIPPSVREILSSAHRAKVLVQRLYNSEVPDTSIAREEKKLIER